MVAVPGRMYHRTHNTWVVPKRVHYGQSDTPFYNCFPADHVNQSDLQSDLAKYGNDLCRYFLII